MDADIEVFGPPELADVVADLARSAEQAVGYMPARSTVPGRRRAVGGAAAQMVTPGGGAEGRPRAERSPGTTRELPSGYPLT